MPGPFNPRCNCRCAIPFPDCFGCLVMDLPAVPENITLVAASFSWTFPETNVSSEAWRDFSSYSYDTEHRTRTRPLSNINGTRQMRAKPDGSCFWLWNDVRAVSTVYRDGASRFLDETIYEPLNAVDVTSPWDRVILPNDDYRCGTRSPICLTGIDASTAITFTPIEVFEPNTINQVAGWYWFLRVNIKIARSAIAGDPYAFNAALPFGATADHWKVTPVNYAMRTSYGLTPFDYTSNATSIPPYRYEGGVPFPVGGLLEEYLAPIDCVNDFLGNPITLTKNAYSSAQSSWFDATTPATVQVTL